MRINLFELHDSVKDDKPKKWICAKGKDLEPEIKEIISGLAKKGKKKADLIRYLMKKFKISKPTAARLVYLRKEWLPLIYIKKTIISIWKRKRMGKNSRKN